MNQLVPIRGAAAPVPVSQAKGTLCEQFDGWRAVPVLGPTAISCPESLQSRFTTQE